MECFYLLIVAAALWTVSLCDDKKCAKDPECGTNEEIRPCAKPSWCNTCGIRGNCKLANCSSGCDCKEGYYRDDQGLCIPQDQCPKECGTNEEVRPCAKPSWCNTCGIRGNCKLANCSSGCDCKEGYYRDDQGVCIPQEECPKETPKCGKLEQYYECMPRCQGDCLVHTSKGKIACRFPCLAGCFCKSGYYKASDGRCVRSSQCPKPDDDACGKNEVVKDCALPEGCNTCQNPNGITCKVACKEGCDCKDNYHRNANGVCISAAQCAAQG